MSQWVSYQSFRNGSLRHPFFREGKFLTQEKIAVAIVGKSYRNSLGQKATVVAFRSFYDIDAVLENGTVVVGIAYKDFVTSYCDGIPVGEEGTTADFI